MKKIVLVIALFLLIGESRQETVSECKKCTHTHPQDIFCHSEFVGVVRVTEANIENDVKNVEQENNVTAQVTILKVYKGKYEDFVEGSSIYLYSPLDKECQREYWKDDFIISGKPEFGGLLSTICDFRESRSTFSSKQLKAIESHIHNRAYMYGCEHCTIKKPYDYSAVQVDQCKHKLDEFPISTSACVHSSEKGRCELVAKSNERYKLPRQPKAQKKTLPPRDFIPNELHRPQEGGCLYNRIKEKSKTPISPVENKTKAPSTVLPHFTFSNSSPEETSVHLKTSQPKPKERTYRMHINWNHFKKLP